MKVQVLSPAPKKRYPFGYLFFWSVNRENLNRGGTEKLSGGQFRPPATKRGVRPRANQVRIPCTGRTTIFLAWIYLHAQVSLFIFDSSLLVLKTFQNTALVLSLIRHVFRFPLILRYLSPVSYPYS